MGKGNRAGDQSACLGHVLFPNPIVVCILLKNVGTTTEQIAELRPLIGRPDTIIRVLLSAQHKT